MVAELLVSTSKAYPVEQGADKARAARKRLAVLLVVSDVLHADKFHKKNHKNQSGFAYKLKPEIEELVQCAAEAIDNKDTAQENKLKALINFWATSGCIDNDLYRCLRERFAEGLAVARGGTPVRQRTYKMPEIFGEQNLPWYEQPASYMIEPLIEHPDQPIVTGSIQAERPGYREASNEVRAMIDDFFDNIDLKYMPTGDNPTGGTKKYNLWLDPLGQTVKQNKVTGDIKTISNGYGWSPKFCRDMQDIGLPSTIVDKRAAHIEKMKLMNKERLENERRTRISPVPAASSPRRRRISSSVSDRGSDDERPSSRDSGRDQYRQRPSSRDEDRHYDRRSGFDDAQRQPPNQYTRGSQHSNQRWNNHGNHPQASRNNYGGRGGNGNAGYTQGFPQAAQGFPQAPQGFPQAQQAFSQAPQTFNNAPGFHPPPPPPPPPPPMQGQYSGAPFVQPPQYFPGGQVPLPPHIAGAGGPPPLPPPPNYNGVYNPPSNLAGQPGNPYFQGGNVPGFGNQANNNPAYNNHVYNNGGGYGGQPQPQRGFGGGFQGRGNRGGNRGDNRGGIQGQWGGRGRY